MASEDANLTDFYGARESAITPGRRWTGKSLHDRFVQRADDYLQLAYRQVHAKRRNAWNESERDFWAQVDREALEAMRSRGVPTFDDPFVLPVIHTHINSIAAAQFQILTERDPRVELSPRIANQEEPVQRVELVMNDQYQRGRLDWVLWQRLLHAQIYGFSPRATFWNHDRQMNETFAWDPFLFYWDPHYPVTSSHRGRFVAFQSTSTPLEMRREGIYFNLNEIRTPESGYLKTFGYGVERDVLGTARNTVFGVNDPTQPQSFRATTKEIVPAITINHTIYFKLIPSDPEWGLADLGLIKPGMDPDEPTIAVMTISNGKTLTRFDYSDFPHKQFPGGVIAPLSDGLIISPPGSAEVNRGPHRYINWLASSRKDNVQKVLNSRGLFNPEMLDIDQLTNPFPGQFIPIRPEHYGSDLGAAYQPLEEKDVTQSHINDIRFMISFMELDMGSTEPIQGRAPQREYKATVFSIITRAVQGRHAVFARIYEEQDLADMVAQMIANTKAFMEMPVWVRMTAQTSGYRKSSSRTPTHIQIFPEDLENVEADYVPFSPREIAFREKRAEILNSWLRLITSIPELAQRMDLLEIALDIPRYAGERNIDKYVISVEPGSQEEGLSQQGEPLAPQQLLGQPQQIAMPSSVVPAAPLPPQLLEQPQNGRIGALTYG